MSEPAGQLSTSPPDEEEVLAEKYNLSRALLTQYLLRRLILQARYGCVNFQCETPSCFSNQIGTAGMVIPRRPTFPTARLMAYAILSSENPVNFLCNSPLDMGANDLTHSEQDWKAFISHWIGHPLLRGANLAPFSSMKDYTAGEERTKDLDFTPTLSRELIPDNAINLPVPIDARWIVQKYLMKTTADRPDLDSLPQVISLSSAALLFELFDPDAHVIGTRSQRQHHHTLARSLIFPPQGFWVPDSLSSPRENVAQFYRAYNYPSEPHIIKMVPLTCKMVIATAHVLLKDILRGPLAGQKASEFLSPPLFSWFDKYSSRMSALKGNRGLTQSNDILFSVFSSPKLLIKCFLEEEHRSKLAVTQDWPFPNDIVSMFKMMRQANGHFLLDCLSNALHTLQVPSPKLREVLEHDREYAKKLETSFVGEYVPDQDAGYIIYLVLCAILAFFPLPIDFAEVNLEFTLSLRGAYPSEAIWTNPLAFGPLNRLVKRLINVISVRRRFDEMQDEIETNLGANLSPDIDPFAPLPSVYSSCRAWRYVLEIMSQVSVPTPNLLRFSLRNDFQIHPSRLFVPAVIAMLQSLVAANWSSSHVVDRWSLLGSSLDLMLDCYNSRSHNDMVPDTTAISISDALLNPISAAKHFINWTFNPNKRHICEYYPIFSQTVQRHLYRAIHSIIMFNGYITPQHQSNQLMIFSGLPGRRPVFGQLHPPVRGRLYSEALMTPLRQSLGVALSPYLVICCRRDYILFDAINTLWGRSPREFIRPLKVIMGDQSGERGDDQGGVSQEFFSSVFAEICDEGKGYFVDTEHPLGTVYFRPNSTEDLSMFVMIGLLVGLAAHNACTIPIDFPIVFYMKLVGWKPHRLSQITDSWPTLGHSLQSILNWDESEEGSSVEDTFCRTYTFSVPGGEGSNEADILSFEGNKRWNGKSLTNKELDQVKMVTKDNRYRFVVDYVDWLVNKSVEPQFEAFARGFYATLNDNKGLMKAVDPFLLKGMIEGEELTASMLEKAIFYHYPYSRDHPTIQLFWEVVEDYEQPEVCKLLQFITSSSRVPAVGARRTRIFIGPGSSDISLLPTASSCIFTLNLPEYTSKEMLKTKLDIALQHPSGFGIA